MSRRSKINKQKRTHIVNNKDEDKKLDKKLA